MEIRASIDSIVDEAETLLWHYVDALEAYDNLQLTIPANSNSRLDYYRSEINKLRDYFSKVDVAYSQYILDLTGGLGDEPTFVDVCGELHEQVRHLLEMQYQNTINKLAKCSNEPPTLKEVDIMEKGGSTYISLEKLVKIAATCDRMSVLRERVESIVQGNYKENSISRQAQAEFASVLHQSGILSMKANETNDSFTERVCNQFGMKHGDRTRQLFSPNMNLTTKAIREITKHLLPTIDNKLSVQVLRFLKEGGHLPK